jgi:glycosyltransferase involved in cell wall biosynthesis
MLLSERRVKILLLSDNFPPEVNAPASRTFEHAREWVHAGHEVTVVTGTPNFPAGRVFPGYENRLWSTDTVEGIRIVRVWTYIAPNVGVVRRIADYLSFMVTATIASLLVERPDIIVATSPQFFTACAGRAVAALRRKPWVFELRDLWPDSISAVGAVRESTVLRLLKRLEMHLYRNSRGVIAVTNAFREDLIRRGIDARKIEVVTNGVDLSRFRPQSRDVTLVEKFGLQGKFVAGYVGTHGLAHGLETILDAAAILQEQSRDRFRFVMLGDGARKKELQRIASERHLANVIFLSSVPKEEVARYWSLLDVAIIHLRASDLFKSVIPSKLFECMAMGIPVLHGVPGESADIVRREGVGILFESGDANGLAQCLQSVSIDPQKLADLRKAAYCAAPHYDRRVLAARMLQILESWLMPASGCSQSQFDVHGS